MRSQPRTPFINHFHNTKPFPGRVTRIDVTYGGGVTRDVAPFITPVMVLNKDNYVDDGTTLGKKKTYASAPLHWNSTGNDYRYVYLRIYDRSIDINSILLFLKLQPSLLTQLPTLMSLPQAKLKLNI